jgi:hypothetical protein
MANPPRQCPILKEMVIELPENKACLHVFRADAGTRTIRSGMPDRRDARMNDRHRGAAPNQFR